LGSYFLGALLAASLEQKPDVVIAETDPPLLGALCAFLKSCWRCRFVYNVRDLYPDIAVANGGLKNRVLLKLLEVSNRWAYRSADLIVVLGEDMAARVIAKGVPAKKVTVVSDWVDCRQIRPIEREGALAGSDGAFTVMYAGNLGLSQQLDTVVEAAAVLREDRRITFLLVGEGARKKHLQDQVRKLGLRNVRIMPYVPKDQLSESLGAADLHLIPLMPGTTGCMVPSKIYGILAAGRPFIAMMEPFAEAARIALDYHIGFVSEPGNSDELANTLRYAADHPHELREMGRRARQLAEARFDRPVVTERFARLLERFDNGPRTQIDPAPPTQRAVSRA
jgi:glycosyltransferase involved in cell wall biosynthesis